MNVGGLNGTTRGSLQCGGNLFNYAKNSAVEVACYSFENGSHPASAYTLTCKSKTCKATHMYSYCCVGICSDFTTTYFGGFAFSWKHSLGKGC